MRSDVSERLETFAKAQGMSVRQFEQSIGVSNGFVKGTTSGIGMEKIRQICRVFPGLNTDWLITGEGPMLREERGSVTGNTVSGNGNTLAGRVVYPEGRDGGMSLGEEVIRLRAQNDLLREQNEKLISALTARGDRA